MLNYYLNILPEITAISLAYLNIRELLSLFESVSFLKDRYWNDQKFWNTLFQFVISPQSFPTMKENKKENFVSASETNIESQTNTTRSSYIFILENREAFLDTNKYLYLRSYLHQIGNFNSKRLIKEFFETIDHKNIFGGSLVPHHELFFAACCQGHFDLMMEMFPFLDKIEHKSCLHRGIECSIFNGQNHIFEYLENEWNENGYEVDFETLIPFVICGNQKEMFERLLDRKSTIISSFLIVEGAIHFDDRELFDQYSAQIENFSNNQYRHVIQSLMIDQYNSNKFLMYTHTVDNLLLYSDEKIYYLQELFKYYTKFSHVRIDILSDALEYRNSYVLSYMMKDLVKFCHGVSIIITEDFFPFYPPMLQFIMKYISISGDQERRMVVKNIISCIISYICDYDNKENCELIIKDLLDQATRFNLIPLEFKDFKNRIEYKYLTCDYYISKWIQSYQKRKRRIYYYMDLLETHINNMV